MAFDIYAGGFSRFYAREWENVVQKRARETGQHYQMIRPGNDPGPAKWEEVQEAIKHWKAALMSGLRENAPQDLDWREDREAPYFTDRPGWDGYSALVLLAACTATQSPLPETLPKDSLASDIVVRSHASTSTGGFRSVTQAQLWLPGSFEFSFDFVDPCNQKIHISSLKRLDADLRALREKHGIIAEDIGKAAREGYEDNAPFKSLAVFGLAIFTRTASDALHHRLPLMLSF